MIKKIRIGELETGMYVSGLEKDDPDKALFFMNNILVKSEEDIERFRAAGYKSAYIEIPEEAPQAPPGSGGSYGGEAQGGPEPQDPGEPGEAPHEASGGESCLEDYGMVDLGEDDEGTGFDLGDLSAPGSEDPLAGPMADDGPSEEDVDSDPGSVPVGEEPGEAHLDLSEAEEDFELVAGPVEPLEGLDEAPVTAHTEDGFTPWSGAEGPEGGGEDEPSAEILDPEDGLVAGESAPAPAEEMQLGFDTTEPAEPAEPEGLTDFSSPGEEPPAWAMEPEAEPVGGEDPAAREEEDPAPVFEEGEETLDLEGPVESAPEAPTPVDENPVELEPIDTVEPEEAPAEPVESEDLEGPQPVEAEEPEECLEEAEAGPALAVEPADPVSAEELEEAPEGLEGLDIGEPCAQEPDTADEGLRDAAPDAPVEVPQEQPPVVAADGTWDPSELLDLMEAPEAEEEVEPTEAPDAPGPEDPREEPEGGAEDAPEDWEDDARMDLAPEAGESTEGPSLEHTGGPAEEGPGTEPVEVVDPSEVEAAVDSLMMEEEPGEVPSHSFEASGPAPEAPGPEVEFEDGGPDMASVHGFETREEAEPVEPRGFVEREAGEEDESGVVAVEPAAPVAATEAVEDTPPEEGKEAEQEEEQDKTRSDDDKDNRERVSDYKEELVEAKRIRSEAEDLVKDFLGSARAGEGIKSDKVQATVEKMVDSVFRNQDALTSLARLKDFDDYTFSHCINVCVLALAVGRHMRLGKKEMQDLGVGAILHDVGKMLVPQEVLNKPGVLTPDEFEVMRKHTLYGEELLASTSGIDDSSKLIALYHHERYDGKGYLNRISGDGIDLFSRITSVADIYDAMTSNRVYQQGMKPDVALKKMYRMRGSSLDPVMVERLIRCLGVYPIGTFVELNTGEYAVVRLPNHRQPLQPLVLMLFDSHGNRYPEPFEADLNGDDGRWITSSRKTEGYEDVIQHLMACA